MRSFFYCLCAALGLTYGSAALAHPMDASFLDFGPTTSTGATANMTVAVHHHEAYELVRTPGERGDVDLDILRANADILTAYAATHVTVTRQAGACAWDPMPAQVPETEFEATAEGIVITGPLTCPGEGTVVEVSSSLFLERFPNQAVIVRLESPDGFIERTVLTRERSMVSVDLLSVLPFTPPAPTESVPSHAWQDGIWIKAVALIVPLITIILYRRRKKIS